MNLDQIRECMNEMMTYENASKCMNEILQMEGFLPETIDEGDSIDNHYHAMMEDDDLCNEMFESMNSAQNECGDYVREWISENYGSMEEAGVEDLENNLQGGVENINDDVDQSIPDQEAPVDPIVNEEPNGSTYVEKLHWMMEFIETIVNKVNPDQELESWIQDKISVSFQNLEDVVLHLGSEETSGTNTPETNDMDVKIPGMSLMHSLGGDEEDEEGIEELGLQENELPKFQAVKSKGYDTENNKNAKESVVDGLKDAEDSQKTIEQKADNLTNQKFAPNMENGYQKDLKDFHLGYKNALNLDYTNEVSDDYKDRVEMEVTTGHSRKRDEKIVGKEANIDTESKVGERMIKASQENQEFADNDFQPNPIQVTEPDKQYKRTSVTGNKAAKNNNYALDKSKRVNEQLARMKKLF